MQGCLQNSSQRHLPIMGTHIQGDRGGSYKSSLSAEVMGDSSPWRRIHAPFLLPHQHTQSTWDLLPCRMFPSEKSSFRRNPDQSYLLMLGAPLLPDWKQGGAQGDPSHSGSALSSRRSGNVEKDAQADSALKHIAFRWCHSDKDKTRCSCRSCIQLYTCYFSSHWESAVPIVHIVPIINPRAAASGHEVQMGSRTAEVTWVSTAAAAFEHSKYP